MILFINALKSLRSNKLKIILITFLILLSTTIYTSFNTMINSVEKSYDKYLEKYNVFDIAFEINIDYENDFTKSRINSFFKNKKLTEEEEIIINEFLICKQNKDCNNYILYEIENIFSKYKLKDIYEEERLNFLKEKYDFIYEVYETKIISNLKSTIKVIPYKDYRINIPYLVKGNFPKNDNEITILPLFSSYNNLNISDNYFIDNKNYIIAGYTYSTSDIYPTFSNSNPIFDYKNNNIIFTTYDTFNNLKGILNKVYIAKFNNYNYDLFELENDIIKTDKTLLMETSVNTLKEDLIILRVFKNTFLYILLTITIILLLIIIKKKIDIEKPYIGILKSFGYSKIRIALSYLVYPVITSIIGGLFGFIIGFILSDFIKNIYLRNFNIEVLKSIFCLNDLINCIVIPLIFLSFISFIFVLFLLRKKDIVLIKNDSDLKINFLTKFINKISVKKDFLTEFRNSLLTRSLKKLVIIILTSVTIGFLITIIFAWFNLFNKIIDSNFSKYNFSYMITYNNLITNNSDSKSDNILIVSNNIYKITDKNKNPKTLKDNTSVILNGITDDLKFILLTDKDKNLLNLLADKTIIISSKTKQDFNIDIGDFLSFKINDQEISFEVVGVYLNNLDSNCYVKNKDLANSLGFSNNIYNVTYSTDEKYESLNLTNDELSNINEIYSLDVLRQNIINSLSFYNNFTYIVVLFCLILIFIVIAILANILVDENISIISLMKIFGFTNKEISKVIFDGYTKILILFYLLSIPVAKLILNKIMNYLSSYFDINLSFSLNISKLIIGLILFLMCYFIAINLSKKRLNKISQEEILKE